MSYEYMIIYEIMIISVGLECLGYCIIICLSMN